MKRLFLLFPLLLALSACDDSEPVIVGPESDAAVAYHSSRAAVGKLPLADVTIRVPADHATIQEAVAAASSGDRILVAPGTYLGTVSLVGSEKDGLQIIADGDAGSVILQGDHIGMNGECFFARQPLCPEGRAGFYLQDVSGVIIRGFTVTDFGMGAMSGMGEGFLLFNAHNNRIEHNTMTASDMMGLTLLYSAGNVVEHNVVYLNDPDEPNRIGYGCGFHVQGAGAENNVIRKNVVWGNPFAGIMIRIAGDANQVTENVFKNGGLWGITNWATNGTIITGNRVMNHEGLKTPDKLPWTPPGYEFGVGIGVDLRRSADVVVRENVIQSNRTLDIEWDGAGANVFEQNRCKTSEPAGLCV